MTNPSFGHHLLFTTMCILPSFACSITIDNPDEEDEDWTEQNNGQDAWGSGSTGAGSNPGNGSDSTGGSSTNDSGQDDDPDGHLGGLDGGVMNSSPGCVLPDKFCYAFSGPAWAGQDISAICEQLTIQVQAEGEEGPMSHVPEGCPAGALSQCSDILMGGDSDGNPIAGTEGTIFYYISDSEERIQSACTAQGGNYSEL